MADTVVRARLKPAATTLTDLYTATGNTTISSIVVCNQSSTATTLRIAVAPLGAADDTSHYDYYDVAIPGNNTLVLTGGISLVNTDKIRVYVGAATVSLGLYGVIWT